MHHWVSHTFSLGTPSWNFDWTFCFSINKKKYLSNLLIHPLLINYHSQFSIEDAWFE
jgi:hypothetical protein